MAHLKRKMPSNMRKMRIFRPACACAKYPPGLCSPPILSVISNDSVGGQWRPWSDCANAQSDLGLRCPHVLNDSFSHDTVHKLSSWRLFFSYQLITISDCLLFKPNEHMYNGSNFRHLFVQGRQLLWLPVCFFSTCHFREGGLLS